ncbi:hypothetical protein JZ751_016230 [Albula glossodonta]|uniref:Uncharacterized protein n=1 Tax=Albula glossodonta TaxID=121402 RepID=A0A8T2MWJ8_9TELE|nr:hypothetical protein JZ751_016230 [Albula glossodonta]
MGGGGGGGRERGGGGHAARGPGRIRAWAAASWDIFFRNANAGAPPGAAYQSPPPLGESLPGLTQAQAAVGALPNVEKLVEDHLAVQSLIRAYQVRGHHIAKLDPLGISCVDFDDSPVTVGFHQVGEKNLQRGL